MIRQQKLEGFIEGLLSGADELDLPAKASSALDTLGEVRAMIAGVNQVASDPRKPAELDDCQNIISCYLQSLRSVLEIGT